MFRLIRKQLQIFRSVVVSNFIYVMNDFSALNISTYNFFHSQMTPPNAPSVIGKWMIWLVNIYISPCRNIYSTSPIPMIRAHTFTFPKFTKLSFSFFRMFFFIERIILTNQRCLIAYISTFIRTIFSYIFSVGQYCKFFSTDKTNFSHIFSLIKKAAFRYLTDTRLSVSTLLTAISEHRKSVNPLDINRIAYV